MRILYVAADNPAVDNILRGMDSESLGGLPAFYFPFKELLERGHEIDLMLYTPDRKELVESRYFKKKNLILIHPKKSIIPSSVEYFLHMTLEARRILRAGHYDFVYGMSEGSHPVVNVAAAMGIPCALRQFGTQEMANVLETEKGLLKRRFRALKDYTYITLSMFSPKTFLLATNDGSRADQLYDILGAGRKKFAFFFWRSGVAIPETLPVVDFKMQGRYPDQYDSMTLSAINRIADVKRQDRAVRILGELHKRGYLFHLYLIGTIDSKWMYDEAVRAADEYGIRDYLHFEGGKSQKECRSYARNSVATLLTCEWNRVNVFYEVMSEGALVVTNDNHSIDEFIEDGRNCLVYKEDDFGQAAEKIIALLKDPERMKQIRGEAYETAKNHFMSLEKRFGMEADLVEAAAAGKDLSIYPSVL